MGLAHRADARKRRDDIGHYDGQSFEALARIREGSLPPEDAASVEAAARALGAHPHIDGAPHE